MRAAPHSQLTQDRDRPRSKDRPPKDQNLRLSRLKYSSPVEGCSPLPVVAELGPHLVASSPVGPQKYLPLWRHTSCRKLIKQPAYLRYGQGQERFFEPLFKASFERT